MLQTSNSNCPLARNPTSHQANSSTSSTSSTSTSSMSMPVTKHSRHLPSLSSSSCSSCASSTKSIPQSLGVAVSNPKYQSSTPSPYLYYSTTPTTTKHAPHSHKLKDIPTYPNSEPQKATPTTTATAIIASCPPPTLLPSSERTPTTLVFMPQSRQNQNQLQQHAKSPSSTTTASTTSTASTAQTSLYSTTSHTDHAKYSSHPTTNTNTNTNNNSNHPGSRRVSFNEKVFFIPQHSSAAATSLSLSSTSASASASVSVSASSALLLTSSSSCYPQPFTRAIPPTPLCPLDSETTPSGNKKIKNEKHNSHLNLDHSRHYNRLISTSTPTRTLNNININTPHTSISLMPSEMTETVTRKITQPKRHKLRTNSNEVSLNAVHPRQVKARATSQLFWDESQLAVELADDDLMDSIAAARKRAGQTAAAYQRLFDPITRLWSHYSSNSTTPGSGSSGNANGNNNSQSLESPMTVMPQSRKPSTSNSANGLFGSDDLDIKQKTTKTTTRKTKGTKNKISTSAATSTITSASASISISISTSTSISASTSTFTSACASPSTSTSTSTNTNTSTNTTVNATANTTANTTVTASSTTQPTKKPNSRLTRLLKKFSL